ncbi:OLC1v1008530C1 [Oldenlandia corymbosa var. corymbosa]|uniref:OLC1v1008530C1 n=1 Tax=Oldenlandia corymbosa var. corymbosa TaxID=529605 RepID=A0AAV1DM63_OLDCO|nr:OLC1v1008530C1 [Oldenlandia corymbosa var. corymbosa]
MSRIYGNWERLVRETLRREEFRRSALRSPSDLSSSSLSLSSPDDDGDEKLPCPSFLSFTYSQILEATNDFNPSNLISHAKSGRLFRGSLRDGTRVVVKMVDRLGFRLTRTVEIHRELSHSRLVPLLGDVQNLLVYKYMSKGDLSRNLREIGCWERRLKIAIGAAEALTYLHHEFMPPLVHR